MAQKLHRSMTDALRDFLATKDEQGATLAEIYAAVHADLGDNIIDTSIRSILYKRLAGAKGKYKPYFERRIVNGKYQYKLLDFPIK
jgi:hypothetical protein